MKRILSVFILAFLLMFTSVTAFAEGEAVIEFDSYESDDGKIYVDVTISENDASMIQFCVDYDSESLECVSASAGSVFSGKSAPLINVTEGKIFFIWDALEPLRDAGVLLRIEFELKVPADSEVGIDEDESFVVANSKFEEIGSIGDSAEINKAPESSSSEAETPPEQEKPEAPESQASVPELGQSSSSSSSSPDEESEAATDDSSPPEAVTGTGTGNGIELDRYSADLVAGDELLLTAKGGEKIVWFSSNENVATVEDGRVKAISPGTAIITASTEDGTSEATCVVNVSAPEEEQEPEATPDSETEPEQEIIVSGEGQLNEKKDMPAWVFVLIAVSAAAAAVFILYGRMRK